MGDKSLRFLYHTLPGRVILKLLTHPAVSIIGGKFMDTGLSAAISKPFIRHCNIDMAEYEEKTYTSFNDFFTRKIRKGCRIIPKEGGLFISPCDGLLSIREISRDTVLPVKESEYTVSSLLRSKRLASLFEGGLCFIFRLSVNHYHRYIYLDSGYQFFNRRIPGVLHTVRPIALRTFPVFTENSREYALIKSQHFGPLIQMEVGAMLVGRIDNHRSEGNVERGDEKGCFLYGGSTIIVLLKRERVRLSENILPYVNSEKELPVRQGEILGYSGKENDSYRSHSLVV